MTKVNVETMFAKVKAAYPEPYREGDTVWELVDAYVATKNYAFDGQLVLQSRVEKDGKITSVTTYTNYMIDEEEME